MPKFNVEIPHTLDAAAAKARLQKAQTKLEADYGAKCSWASENVMQVSRKGLDAQVKITDSALLVDVSLGLLLTPMMGPIREGITSRLTKLVTEG
ncbi:MAG: polyhydroxyalkanoic acid system family protein [Deltaproteobacteria bacterium]|nr:polyhydroxyalkanoic acid system family protein [Deltaproteobacteria bacterium]